MKPFDQTVTGEGGDCFRTALGCILEMPPHLVTNFRLTEPDDMHGAAARWLAARDVRFVSLYFAQADDLASVHFNGPPAYCLLCGPGPRLRPDGTNRAHAVVGRTRAWGVEEVFDPHPDRSGLLPAGHRWLGLVLFPPRHPLCEKY